MLNRVELIVTQSSKIDCMALTELLRMATDFHVVYASTVLRDALEECRYQRPEVVILDLSSKANSVFSAAEHMLAMNRGVSAFLLDDRLTIASLERAIAMPFTSYYTKDASFESICDGIRKLSRGVVTFDPNLDGILSTTIGSKNPTIRLDQPSFLDLTTRERQVFKMLAGGCAVRDVAAQLELSPSTVDNHKSRLMKKLGIHKMGQITEMALREKIID